MNILYSLAQETYKGLIFADEYTYVDNHLSPIQFETF